MAHAGILTVSLDHLLLSKSETAAHQYGITRSEVARRCIAQGDLSPLGTPPSEPLALILEIAERLSRLAASVQRM
jgi:hypothetical protein